MRCCGSSGNEEVASGHRRWRLVEEVKAENGGRGGGHSKWRLMEEIKV